MNPRQLETGAAVMNRIGSEPRELILDAVRNNRLVGMGETHGVPNGFRQDALDLLPKMKAAGLTHLAVEVNKDQQPLLDDYVD